MAPNRRRVASTCCWARRRRRLIPAHHIWGSEETPPGARGIMALFPNTVNRAGPEACLIELAAPDPHAAGRCWCHVPEPCGC